MGCTWFLVPSGVSTLLLSLLLPSLQWRWEPRVAGTSCQNHPALGLRKRQHVGGYRSHLREGSSDRALSP